MGKSGGRVLYRPSKRGRRRRGCFDCHRPIVYGDRCPECVAKARAQAIDRKRKRR
jgi:hypothetical protein